MFDFFFFYVVWFCLKGSKIVNLFVDYPIDWLYYFDFSLLYHAIDWLYCCDFSLLYHAIMVIVDYHVVVIFSRE